MIDSDQVDYLYFLTNPVVSINNSGKMVSFVFVEHLFLIQYSNSTTSNVPFGLSTFPIYGLYGADFDIDLIQISSLEEGENLVALVSESNRIYVLSDTRQANMGVLETLRAAIGVYLMITGEFFEQLVNLWIFPEDIVKTLTPISKVLLDKIESSSKSWSVLGTWSTDLAGLSFKVSSLSAQPLENNWDFRDA